MCHLILLLPVLALPVFWLLPASQSIPIYALVVLVSGWIYWYAIKAMRLPLESEDAQMMRATGRVVGADSHGRYRIEILGEYWLATSSGHLQEGDLVSITGRDGLILLVEKAAHRQRPDRASASP